MSTANPQSGAGTTLDPTEVERFERIASEWWDPAGKFRPLHEIGPARLAFIRDEVCRRFGRTGKSLRSLTELSVLDVGCGGGLIAEPLCRLGGRVTGIDPASGNIDAARQHAGVQGLDIDYRPLQIEDITAAGETFDVVVCLEVVEHVPDVSAFVDALAGAVRPGGLLILSTINRTVKAYALAIVGAEYILRWLPAGTHQWDRFVTPDELRDHLTRSGLVDPTFAGLVYDPFTGTWSVAADTSVNYFAAAAKSG